MQGEAGLTTGDHHNDTIEPRLRICLLVLSLFIAGWTARPPNSLVPSFIWPLRDEFRITSYFSISRIHPIARVPRPHWGIDLAAPYGTPIYAAACGTVTFRGYRHGNGNSVEIKHDAGYESVYFHLRSFASHLWVGQRIERGALLGFVGSSGSATGPHLHFGIRHYGYWVDPLDFL